MAFTNAQMAQAFGDELDLSPEQVEALEMAFDQWAIGGARLPAWSRLATDVSLFNNAAVAMVHDWYGGTAAGGPNGDGLYPLMNSDGEIFYVPSPARVAADLTGFEPMGTLASTSDLPASGSPGDLWIVAGNAWGWNNRLAAWRNLGPFRGATGASAKQIVINAGLLPAGAADAAFATWLANAQIAAVQPSVDAAEAAALAAQGDAAATAADRSAVAVSRDAAASSATASAGSATAAAGSATAASVSASGASASAVDALAAVANAEEARDDAVAAKGSAEAAATATAADRLATDGDRTAVAADRAAAATAATTATGAASTATDAATTASGAASTATAAAGTATAAAADADADRIAAAAARADALAAQAAAELARDAAAEIVGGDFLTETAANALYRKLSDALAVSDITGLSSALAAKATPADITAAINALVAGAPAALDTLKELADALEDNDDALAALVLLVGEKADKSTTYTKTEVEGLLPLPWHSVTAAYTATANDQVLANTSAGAWSLTLPATAGVVRVRDAAGTWATNSLTVIGSIRGSTGNLVCDVSSALEFVRHSSAGDWIVSKANGVAA